ncbi:prepilin peptidase [Nocardioides euryhalodurans]|uniref:Prepilin peptidase n=1 Tax=Nocardioides euryhalodurans TaxID=2518370 RepID=A0A4P7GI21_9ACTN|nr:A24 family peptidase [Nocardioides euryhalodurans]QBR91374.1 prepilin peptidase [Nocardioides euryhalodurans]
MTPTIVLGAALAAGLGGLLVPRLIALLPEPDLAEDAEPKPPYAEIGARPGLAWRAALACTLAGGLLGASVGRDWWLAVLVLLVPVLAALSVVDWHTKLLPSRLVLPATAFAVVAALAGWGVTGDTDDLVRAGLGLVIARSLFWVLWFVHSAGMGFGDVRLAALLGIALGHLGWGELAVGVYSGFLVFGIPGLVLAVVRRDRRLLRAAYPFGPFMVLGALVGVLTGPWVASYLGWG